MSLSERVESTLERWSVKWKDRLRGWMVSWVSKGIISFLESEEPQLVKEAKGMLDRVLANPETPNEVRTILTAAKGGGRWLHAILLIVSIAMFTVQLIQQLFRPAFNLAEQKEHYAVRDFRLDPLSVITAWRRDPAAWTKLFDDLREQGWSDERIDALKFITQYFPSPSDIIRFGVREVYTKAIRDAYRLEEDFPDEIKPDAAKAGLPEAELLKYWAAHWELPSPDQGAEMLHRGRITEDEYQTLLRTLDVMPFWRDKMGELAWNLPNRIEIRMMARYLDLSKGEVMEMLKNAGLREDFRSDAADFMIIMGLTGYWADLLRNNWISPEGLKVEIASHGLKDVTADRIYKSLVKYVKPERVAKEKDLTAAEIIKGVKKGVITEDEGVETLMDLGYDEWEASFKLAIELTAAAGSPESYAEFKDLTQKWRLAAGMEGKPMTEELKQLGRKVVTATDQVAALQKVVDDTEAQVIDEDALSPEARAPLTEKRRQLYLAQAELARLQTDYKAKLAAWRQGV